jgi:hypothetical protein
MLSHKIRTRQSSKPLNIITLSKGGMINSSPTAASLNLHFRATLQDRALPMCRSYKQICVAAQIPANRLLLETDCPDGLPQLSGEWAEALPGLADGPGGGQLLAGVHRDPQVRLGLRPFDPCIQCRGGQLLHKDFT